MIVLAQQRLDIVSLFATAITCWSHGIDYQGITCSVHVFVTSLFTNTLIKGTDKIAASFHRVNVLKDTCVILWLA